MSISEEINELVRLREGGHITDEEFATAKQRLLNTPSLTDGGSASATQSELEASPMPEGESATQAQLPPGSTLLLLSEMSGMRRLPSGEAAVTVCTHCEHAFALSTDLLNGWLQSNSTSGKLIRAGHSIQHAGNVMTPGIGWMLAGRSARAVNADKVEAAAMTDALRCPSCGSTGTVAVVQPNQVQARSVARVAVATLFFHFLYLWAWMRSRREMLRYAGIETSPASGAWAMSPFTLWLFGIPAGVALLTTSRHVDALTDDPDILPAVDVMKRVLTIAAAGLLLIILASATIPENSTAFTVAAIVGGAMFAAGVWVPAPFLQSRINRLLREK